MTSNENDNTLEIPVEETDGIARGSMTLDDWYPHFKHLASTGTIKFTLFNSCPCSLELSFSYEDKGVALVRNTTKCDLCTENKEDNSERMGAVMDGFSALMAQTLETGKGQEFFAEQVKEQIGRDIGSSGHKVKVNKKHELASRLFGDKDDGYERDLQSDAQVLMMTALQLLDWIDVSKLTPIQQDQIIPMTQTIEAIRNKEAFAEPTETIRKIMDKANENEEKL